jgi:hypothetical protein
MTPEERAVLQALNAAHNADLDERARRDGDNG